jgi:site-specific DNA-methyltransferase (adenine-specific)
MAEKSGFVLSSRNPDILTSIANLSNDEVFTPPAFANQMLDTVAENWAQANDGADLWADSAVTFLDPFTKSGVFLREITRRLSDGLESEFPDIQKRIDHILTKQVFGVAITELTSLLARRSVYCSKWANGRHSIATEFTAPEGNIWFERTEHTWVGGKERVTTFDESGNEVEIVFGGRCKFCGAKQRQYERGAAAESHAYSLIHTDDLKAWVANTFGEPMQFDVILGNPPYQLNDGGYGTSAGPIYNKFVEQAMGLEPRFLSMVIPSRWFTGGKGLDDFRKAMLSAEHLRVIEDYPDSSQIFPGVQIKNGVCFFLWDRDNPGSCMVTNHLNGAKHGPVARNLLEKDAEVFLRYNSAVSVVRKVMAIENGLPESETPFSLPPTQRFSALVSSRRPFGLDTTFKGATTRGPDELKVYRNGGIGYMHASEIPAGEDLIPVWKVFIPRASSGSDSFPHPILGIAFAGEPESICSETYIAIGPFSTEVICENVISYLRTRFARFMALQNKSSQDATKAIYNFVPLQDFNQPWSDKALYARYNLTEAEIAFIESMIRPMEPGSE